MKRILKSIIPIVLGILCLSMFAAVVHAQSLSVYVSPDIWYLSVGQHGTFAATASGGTPPYTYRWAYATNYLVALIDAEQASPSSSTYTFTARATGSYYVVVFITDSVGNHAADYGMAYVS